MARALATEGHMNFLAVKGPELLSKWLGESERALASLFRRARMASPAIIFFDEIDAIAIRRGSGDSPSSTRLLAQLLTEMDGIHYNPALHNHKQEIVIVIGATNRPDLLDPALTRPGRIDQMIYVGVPDIESRVKIFEIGLEGRACCDDIDITTLASDEVSGGYSGAEIIAICRDAALLALEEADDMISDDMPSIAMRHMMKAIDSIQRQITPEMIEFYESFARRPR
jgi:SpoVK/Ycf46/Vps4 family AAA+-type ATPase